MRPALVPDDFLRNAEDIVEHSKRRRRGNVVTKPCRRYLHRTGHATGGENGVEIGHVRKPALGNAGAKGAILKSADLSELRKAIADVAAGQTYISSEIRHIMDEDPPVEVLSPRQGEILQAIARGLNNADIAKLLGTSLDMVREHTSALFQNLGAANRTEAVAIALRKHLLKA